MPLTIEWLDAEKSIICCTGKGKWGWAEYHNALDEIVVLFKASQHPVDLIIVREPQSMMPSGSSMPHFQRAMRIMPPNVGQVAIVNTSAFARAIVSIFTKFNNTKNAPRLVMAASVEDAKARILRQRTQQHAVAA